MEIENWSGKSIKAVYQDFYAKVFSENLTALLTSEVEEEVEAKTHQRKHAYKINFSAALSKMKHALTLLFIRSNPFKILEQLLKVWITDLTPIRLGRNFPRKGHGNKKNPVKVQHFAAPYKRTR